MKGKAILVNKVTPETEKESNVGTEGKKVSKTEKRWKKRARDTKDLHQNEKRSILSKRNMHTRVEVDPNPSNPKVQKISSAVPYK